MMILSISSTSTATRFPSSIALMVSASAFTFGIHCSVNSGSGSFQRRNSFLCSSTFRRREEMLDEQKSSSSSFSAAAAAVASSSDQHGTAPPRTFVDAQSEQDLLLGIRKEAEAGRLPRNVALGVEELYYNYRNTDSFEFSPHHEAIREPFDYYMFGQNYMRPLIDFRSCRFGVKCSTIDVVADIKTEKIVVLGGSGFVGSAICRAAISKGIEVISVSRSGRPSYSGSWVDQVTWVTGDVFYVNWDEVLVGASAVVSTLGGFGSEEQMQRINGEANVVAVNAAKDFGIPKFILISVHDYNLPSFLLTSGYFTGKRKAEAEVLSKYPTSGVVFRPGFIYGKRKVDGYEIPLDLIGQPLEKFLLSVENFTKPLNSLPASDLLLAPPVSVDDLAFAVVNSVTDNDFFGIFTIEQIKEAAKAVKV